MAHVLGEVRLAREAVRDLWCGGLLAPFALGDASSNLGASHATVRKEKCNGSETLRIGWGVCVGGVAGTVAALRGKQEWYESSP